MGFELEYRPSTPWRLGTNGWYNQKSLISPFWALSDEITLGLLPEECSNSRSKVYYQEYERSVAMSDETRIILDRAMVDVQNSCK